MTPTHECKQCGTQYFKEGGCDWCPVQLSPLTPTVRYRPSTLDEIHVGHSATLFSGTIDHPNLYNDGGMVFTSIVRPITT